MMIVAKSAYTTLLSSVRPNAIQVVKLNKKPMTKREADGIVGYFLLFFLVLAISVFALCLCGNSFQTSFYSALTMFNNMGPCLSPEVGATASYASFNWISKLIMMADMLIGRLEIFPILLLFSPKAWSRKF
jgi:trk system potassium uptake protein TrkH